MLKRQMTDWLGLVPDAILQKKRRSRYNPISTELFETEFPGDSDGKKLYPAQTPSEQVLENIPSVSDLKKMFDGPHAVIILEPSIIYAGENDDARINIELFWETDSPLGRLTDSLDSGSVSWIEYPGAIQEEQPVVWKLAASADKRVHAAVRQQLPVPGAEFTGILIANQQPIKFVVERAFLQSPKRQNTGKLVIRDIRFEGVLVPNVKQFVGARAHRRPDKNTSFGTAIF